jgi:hypothetical protein
MKISIKNTIVLETMGKRFAANQRTIQAYENIAEKHTETAEEKERYIGQAKRIKGENEGIEHTLGVLFGFDMHNFDCDTTGKKKGFMGWLNSKPRQFFLDCVIAASND